MTETQPQHHQNNYRKEGSKNVILQLPPLSSSPPTVVIDDHAGLIAASQGEQRVKAAGGLSKELQTQPEQCVCLLKANVGEGVKESPEWNVLPASAKSSRTKNPIRAIVDPIVAQVQTGQERGDGKDMISLALGDPTAAGNLAPCRAAAEAVMQTLQSDKPATGYVNACGAPTARQAIAKAHVAQGGCPSIQADNVVVASGCSGALELVLTALLDPGTILLVPQPGFPLYQVIAESHGARTVPYRLQADQNWQVDLRHVQQLVQMYGRDRVRGIVICNPSNPTGAVFSWQHLTAIIHLADQCQLPIVADEVYGDLTFGSNRFYPLARIAAVQSTRRVPVITCSGLGKQFLLPGWRVGWAVFQDNVYGSLKEVEAGAKRLAQVILGASHLTQAAIPTLLDPDSESIAVFKQELRSKLEEQATAFCTLLRRAPGLHVLPAGGAMYTMVRFQPSLFDESIQNDLDFSKRLLLEENVFVLPGTCFGASPDTFRIVFCAPVAILREAAERIHHFCTVHTTPSSYVPTGDANSLSRN